MYRQYYEARGNHELEKTAMKTPHAILVGLALIAAALFFREPSVSPAEASVGGMGYHELRRDRDFKKAVRYVAEKYCSVDGSDISC